MILPVSPPSITLELTPDPKQAHQAYLRRGDLRRERPVPGVWLEAEFQCDGMTVLFVSDDCSFEEGLHIYLLDDRLRILDERTIGHIYTPGLFKILSVNSCELEFEFFGHDRWKLSLIPPTWRFHIPVGVAGNIWGICARPVRLFFRPDRLRLDATVTLDDESVRTFRF